MSYFSAYFSRRKAEYVCDRCGKESRVVISKIIIPIFIIAAVISLAIMGLWWFFKLLSNPLGIFLVAAPLVIFQLLTPKFVQLEPLKKYRKSMEAKKAGIEYSDNLTALDFEDAPTSIENSGQFKINSDIFNQIKSQRSTPRGQVDTNELVSDSGTLEKESYVPIIDDVREEHGGTTSYPLKKLRSERSRSSRQAAHYATDLELDNAVEADITDDYDVKEYVRSDFSSESKKS